MVIGAVVSLAGGDGGSCGLEWNTLYKSTGALLLGKSKLFRVSMSLVGSRSSETDPVVTCQFSRLRAPRARDTHLGQGLRLHRSVDAGLLRAPKPRAREKTRARKKKNADVQKNPFRT